MEKVSMDGNAPSCAINACEQKRQTRVNRIISFAALLLIVLPVGMASIVLGYGMGDNPCILCWEERIIIILVALIALFIIRYGLKPRYIGALVLTSLYGLWAGFRHSSGHLLKDLGQGFGPAILGLHTYVWIMVIFALILLFGAILLIFQGDALPAKKDPHEWSGLNKLTVIVFQIVLLFNIVQAATQVGPFPYIGQGDPYRMSFNPHKIKWSMEHWPTVSSFSFNKKFSIERPDFSQAAESAVPVFAPVKSWKADQVMTLPSTIEGAVTGISYSPEARMFALVTNQNWVYFMDESLNNQLAAVKIDGAFSIELSNFADIAFDGPDTVLVTTDHKTYVRLKYEPTAKVADSFYLFRDGSTDGVSELARSVFSTVRAKYNYIGSLAWDAKSHEYVTVSLPSTVHQNFVMIRLSGQDYQLNSEQKIKTPDNILPSVTGLVLHQNMAYLLAHSARQVLVMSNESANVEQAYAIDEVKNPQGMTTYGNQLLVLDTDGKTNKIFMYAMNDAGA